MESLVIGIDAASWDRIDPLLAEGDLPNIGSLVDRGASGPLSSTQPPLTPVAWTSIATGTNPGKHGIYGFRSIDPDTREISTTDFNSMNRPTVWEALNHLGESVGVVNYPASYPPPDVDSFFVSGFPAPGGADLASKKAVNERIDDSEYSVKPEIPPEVDDRRYFDELVRVTNARYELTRDLMNRYEPDHLWTIFMNVDRAQHFLWDTEVDGEDAVDAIYRLIDSHIGKLLEKTDEETTVMIVSDHGMCQIRGEIHMNSVLNSAGHLVRRQRNREILGVISEQLWRVGHALPYDVKSFGKRLMPGSSLEQMRSAAEVGTVELGEILRWEETNAFTFDSMGPVYIHREDQYPDGSVSPEEYEDVRDAVAGTFETLEHPETGEELVERVHTREELYHGPETETAPDLLVEPTEWAYMLYGDFNDEWIHEPEMRIADHHPEGVFIASGPNVPDASPEVDAVDIAPTLLSVLGKPLIEDMDGSVPPSLGQPESSGDVLARTELSPNGDGERGVPGDVEEQLQDLGYF
jgi:predicted AlkP superfamily phosphohydrolase/phosphomutase